jgi:hypothetical protein
MSLIHRSHGRQRTLILVNRGRRISRRQTNLIRRLRGQQTTILRQPRHRTQGRQRNRTLFRARSDRLPMSTSSGVFLGRYPNLGNSSVAFLAPVRCNWMRHRGPGDLQGIFNFRAYVTASPLPLLSTNDRNYEHSDILINC